MALSRESIRSDYPLPVYNYRVEIGGDTVSFSEVSGLTIAYETTTFLESPTARGAVGPNMMIMPAQAVAPTITLRKGLVRRTSVEHLYRWISTVRINQVEKKDLFVRLCDEKGDAVITWKIGNAFPVRLDAPTFDANSNDAAIETIELKADYIMIEEA
ncbi:MAG: phage tail protein [Myxococcales bacterium]|nr:phage tail protein [Myxococcales bacterium]